MNFILCYIKLFGDEINLDGSKSERYKTIDHKSHLPASVFLPLNTCCIESNVPNVCCAFIEAAGANKGNNMYTYIYTAAVTNSNRVNTIHL